MLYRNYDKRTGKYNPDLVQGKYEKWLKEKLKFIHFTEEVIAIVVKKGTLLTITDRASLVECIVELSSKNTTELAKKPYEYFPL